MTSIRLKELATRWDYDDPAYVDVIDERFSIDQSKHSLFGASKVAADVMVQEYGRYFGMKTCCLRGGCLTGPSHSGVSMGPRRKSAAQGAWMGWRRVSLPRRGCNKSARGRAERR